MEQTIPSINLLHLLPELILIGMALVITVLSLKWPNLNTKIFGLVVIVGILASAALVVLAKAGTVYGDLFMNDASSQFFKLIFLSTTILVVGMMLSYPSEKAHFFNLNYCLLLLSVVAMMFLSMASSLLTLYICLELATIPLVILVFFHSIELSDFTLSQKFILTTICSSLLIIIGYSFLYGLSGETSLILMKLKIALVHITQRQIGVIVLLAIVTVLTGLMLRGGLIPFHNWLHDVHMNSPIWLIAFLTIALTAAVLVTFAKVFINGLFAFYGPEMNPNDWGRLTAFVAFVAMAIGTVQMLKQKELISMMFYVVMVQVGFVLTGMISMNLHGLRSAGFYLFALNWAAIGVYAVTELVRRSTRFTQLDDFKGLFKSSWPLSILMTIYLMSLAGLPGLAGFVAKFSVIEAAIEMGNTDRAYHWMYLLVGAGITCSALIFVKMASLSITLFTKSEKDAVRIPIPIPLILILAATALGIVFFGILPDSLLTFTGNICRAFGFMID